MTRAFQESRLIIASHNQGKCREIAAYLTPYAIEILEASDLTYPNPMRPAPAIKPMPPSKPPPPPKPPASPHWRMIRVLKISALGSKPGIYSARLAGVDKNFTRASEILYNDLIIAKASDFSCQFICALALCWGDGFCLTVEGYIDGTFIWPPRGDQGFGYDPVFQPHGCQKTFAELAPEWKHAHSHRAKAFQQLIAQCFQKTPTYK